IRVTDMLTCFEQGSRENIDPARKGAATKAKSGSGTISPRLPRGAGIAASRPCERPTPERQSGNCGRRRGRELRLCDLAQLLALRYLCRRRWFQPTVKGRGHSELGLCHC